MKEKIKFLILIIVFIVLLFAINTILNNSNSNIEIPKDTDEKIENEVENSVLGTNENTSNTEKTNQEIGENVANTSEEGIIVEVTENNFEEEVLKSDKTVLIDFYADWCNPCKILSPIVEEVAKENTDLKVVKIDVDTNPRLSYEYGAYSIPTLVVIKNGEETNRAVGVISKENILKLVK